MLSAIVIFPALVAFYLALTRSVPWAFVHAYIPILLWFPSYFQWHIPGIPDPNFAEAAIVPLTMLLLIRGPIRWQVSFTDILVLGFVILTCISEYRAFGYKLAQNLMATMLLSVWLPYALAKICIEPTGLRVNFGKVVAVVLFIISAIMVFDMLIGPKYTLWQRVLGRFFNSGWTRDIEVRWGLTRAEGPFAHSIYACIILIMGYRIQRWLEWHQAWPLKLKGFPSIAKLSPARIISLGLLAGIFSTLSRGPWLSGILAAAVLLGLAMIVKLFKRPLQRYLIMGIILLGVVAGGLAVDKAFKQFAAVGMEEASESSQERQTVAYRFELFTTYGEIIVEKWALGWGRLGWPQEKIQWSIDNAYLLLALNHGLIVVGCFIALLFYLMIRLFIRSMSQPVTDSPSKILALTLLAILIVEGFSLATVSLQATNQTLLFIIFGWSDAYLTVSRQDTPVVATINQDNSSLPFRFQRVI
ncbi:MAG: hypothetical protein BWK78_01040 [Thiotrichaceae bacterium IS1]|nr:MAG: hypothetical protein BWK78_01040 [Thiotrichaceae bacterium IS1]